MTDDKDEIIRNLQIKISSLQELLGQFDSAKKAANRATVEAHRERDRYRDLAITLAELFAEQAKRVDELT